jgi:hypothetical protein
MRTRASAPRIDPFARLMWKQANLGWWVSLANSRVPRLGSRSLSPGRLTAPVTAAGDLGGPPFAPTGGNATDTSDLMHVPADVLLGQSLLVSSLQAFCGEAGRLSDDPEAVSAFLGGVTSLLWDLPPQSLQAPSVSQSSQFSNVSNVSNGSNGSNGSSGSGSTNSRSTTCSGSSGSSEGALHTLRQFLFLSTVTPDCAAGLHGVPAGAVVAATLPRSMALLTGLAPPVAAAEAGSGPEDHERPADAKPHQHTHTHTHKQPRARGAGSGTANPLSRAIGRPVEGLGLPQRTRAAEALVGVAVATASLTDVLYAVHALLGVGQPRVPVTGCFAGRGGGTGTGGGGCPVDAALPFGDPVCRDDADGPAGATAAVGAAGGARGGPTRGGVGVGDDAPGPSGRDPLAADGGGGGGGGGGGQRKAPRRTGSRESAVPRGLVIGGGDGAAGPASGGGLPGAVGTVGVGVGVGSVGPVPPSPVATSAAVVSARSLAKHRHAVGAALPGPGARPPMGVAVGEGGGGGGGGGSQGWGLALSLDQGSPSPSTALAGASPSGSGPPSGGGGGGDVLSFFDPSAGDVLQVAAVGDYGVEQERMSSGRSGPGTPCTPGMGGSVPWTPSPGRDGSGGGQSWGGSSNVAVAGQVGGVSGGVPGSGGPRAVGDEDPQGDEGDPAMASPEAQSPARGAAPAPGATVTALALSPFRLPPGVDAEGGGGSGGGGGIGGGSGGGGSGGHGGSSGSGSGSVSGGGGSGAAVVGGAGKPGAAPRKARRGAVPPAGGVLPSSSVGASLPSPSASTIGTPTRWGGGGTGPTQPGGAQAAQATQAGSTPHCCPAALKGAGAAHVSCQEVLADLATLAAPVLLPVAVAPATRSLLAAAQLPVPVPLPPCTAASGAGGAAVAVGGGGGGVGGEVPAAPALPTLRIPGALGGGVSWLDGSVVAGVDALPAPGHPAGTTVWTCGQNSYGELCGLEGASHRVPGLVAQVSGAGVVGIAAGNEHTVMLTRAGEVLSVGYNENGQCGHSAGALAELQCGLGVVHGLGPVDVTQVHAYNGCEHTLMVTRDGQLWAVGYNSRGQLGVGDTSARLRPVCVMGASAAAAVAPGARVTTATCSYYHTLVVCDQGRRLFVCGRNDCGQLGLGDVVDRLVPTEVPLGGLADAAGGRGGDIEPVSGLLPACVC